MSGDASCGATVVTPRVPGALAIIALTGAVEAVLERFAPPHRWPVGAIRHVTIDAIDDPVIMRPAESSALVTPHGGPRIVTRLLDRLVECGAIHSVLPSLPLAPPSADEAVRLCQLFPEATDAHEARMLHLLAHAASPAAVPMLLALPERWRRGEGLDLDPREVRLIVPPRVAIVGPPNAGKSTLLNRLVGRDVAIASDLAGTTRDHVVARVDMAGLVVDLLDTPGLRASDDEIERAARRLAERAIGAADLIVSLAAPGHEWAPVTPSSAQEALRVGAKSDLGARGDADACVSALTGAGIDALRRTIRDALLSARPSLRSDAARRSASR